MNATQPAQDTRVPRVFRQLLVNTLITGVTSTFLWFALTFWVYPDSFGLFRRLQSEAHKAGFVVSDSNRSRTVSGISFISVFNSAFAAPLTSGAFPSGQPLTSPSRKTPPNSADAPFKLASVGKMLSTGPRCA